MPGDLTGTRWTNLDLARATQSFSKPYLNLYASGVIHIANNEDFYRFMSTYTPNQIVNSDEDFPRFK